MCIPFVRKYICRICGISTGLYIELYDNEQEGPKWCSLNETTEYHNLSVLRWFALITEALLCLKKDPFTCTKNKVMQDHQSYTVLPDVFNVLVLN